MKPTLTSAAIAAAIAILGATSTAHALDATKASPDAATVTYVNTEKMTDVPRDQSDLESMKFNFQEHFNRLAAKLPAGQHLKVEIVDIDLAGDVFPRVAVQNVRVMKGRADWPRMHLRYTIEQNGAVIRSGDRQLSDANYLTSPNRYSSEMYGYEKEMLDDWFRKDVLEARPQS